jgi:hypothetical protein
MTIPAICYSRLLEDDSPIMIKRGETGYWPAPGIDVDAENERLGVTPNQREAMTMGSMFGWGVPGAIPAATDTD